MPAKSPLAEHLNKLLIGMMNDVQAAALAALDFRDHGGRLTCGGVRHGGSTWEIHDWSTRTVLASGTDGVLTYPREHARLAALDTGHTGWRHVASFRAQPTEVKDTPGVPPSFGALLAEWVWDIVTPDEEIAELSGLPIEEVSACRVLPPVFLEQVRAGLEGLEYPRYCLFAWVE